MRHSVGGNPYSDTRIGAFIGKKIINAIRARTGRAAVDYLTEISVQKLNDQYIAELPDTIVGSKFLEEYKTHDDPVTTIQPMKFISSMGRVLHDGGRVGQARKARAAATTWSGCVWWAAWRAPSMTTM